MPPANGSRAMGPLNGQETSELLRAWGRGDRQALGRLMPHLYRELRHLARSVLARERRDHTLQPTALVHEAYLRLTREREVEGIGRTQFFCLAARQMRRILVDHARRRGSSKRGGTLRRVPLELALDAAQAPARDLLEVDQALERLEAGDPELARMLELRFFGGLSNPEIGEALGLSLSTVARRWRIAKARLRQLLCEGSDDS